MSTSITHPIAHAAARIVVFAALSAIVGIALSGCLRIRVHGDPAAAAEQLSQRAIDALAAALPLRVASYNVSLYDETAGGVIRRLDAGDEPARKIAAVLQHVRPDLVLLNEFDYDPEGRAADIFQRRYLEVGQDGGKPLHYPYRYFAPVNTGAK
jgi:hypothetical protein